MKRVLITGGAGFIGCHVAATLLHRGCDVRILDSLVEQVHGSGSSRNPIIEDVELQIGDVRDPAAIKRALQGMDAVVHLAAEVGVGQSMYAIGRYVGANDLGTAVLLETLLEHPVQRVVVASSMSVYGEGRYRTASGQIVDDAARAPRRVHSGIWDPVDADDAPLHPLPTPESKPPNFASVYAITKFVQEQLVLSVAAAYGWEGVALRLFNVFGPGQALSNPYTGVLAIFASRILNGERPIAFEDGGQRRDFVHVEDVAEAFALALEAPRVAGGIFNIGSGQSCTILEVAKLIADAMRREDLTPEIMEKARAGDIRHCFADIGRARAELGYWPRHTLADSVAELAEWVAGQRAADLVPVARRELELRGLIG